MYKQKAIELLSQLPEPFRSQALENLERFPLEIKKEPKTVADALDFFDWGKSPQGWIYWYYVHEHYAIGTQLPTPYISYSDYSKLLEENEALKKRVKELEESPSRHQEGDKLSKCVCTPDETTGATQFYCCNICGGQVEMNTQTK